MNKCWIVLCAAWLAAAAEVPPPCESDIYCKGDLLKTVQLAEPKIYDDSKTFVDKKQKNSANVTLEHFREMMDRTGGNPTRDEVNEFVEENFEDGHELKVVEPSDWVESPKLLDSISDPEFRQWAAKLNLLWKNLTREVDIDVKLNSDKYSLLYVPNPFVIPGGRFKELYYWDTYWIVRGLLLCGMTSTVRGILENFLYMQRNYGIVPNGGRVYYLQRSQPPLLTPMVANYLAFTKDTEFLRENINLLEEEFAFWMNKRTVEVTRNGKTYTMARYYAVSSGPRPESYREDYNHSLAFETERRRQEFYVDVKSAAESGWDFSSRWFNKDRPNDGHLVDIDTRNIVPVDLNAFIYWNAQLLSNMFQSLGNNSKARQYGDLANDWKIAVTEVLWDESEGSWFDYDIRNNIPRKHFYPSNLAPLWTGCFDENNAAAIGEKVVSYINRANIMDFWGGIPTSLYNTNEQWDMPNAWPPLQIIAIQGLAQTGHPAAVTLAQEMAQRWVRANYESYSREGDMYEKYNAETPGKYGSGGEYLVQSGFGWTNGIILDLLSHYRNMTVTDGSNGRRRRTALWELLSAHSDR